MNVPQTFTDNNAQRKVEMDQFSEDAIRFGELFEQLDNEQKTVILALLRALDEEQTNGSVSDKAEGD